MAFVLLHCCLLLLLLRARTYTSKTFFWYIFVVSEVNNIVTEESRLAFHNLFFVYFMLATNPAISPLTQLPLLSKLCLLSVYFGVTLIDFSSHKMSQILTWDFNFIIFFYLTFLGSPSATSPLPIVDLRWSNFFTTRYVSLYSSTKEKSLKK